MSNTVTNAKCARSCNGDDHDHPNGSGCGCKASKNIEVSNQQIDSGTIALISGRPETVANLATGVLELTMPWPPTALSPNARTHHMALARAKRAYRNDCFMQAKCQGAWIMKNGPKRVLLRFYPRTRNWPDWDNCIASFKAGLDGIKDAIGVDDSLFRIEFEVLKQVGGMVKVSISEVDG